MDDMIKYNKVTLYDNLIHKFERYRLLVYKENVYSVAVYQKYLTRLGKLIIFELGEKIIISTKQVRYF